MNEFPTSVGHNEIFPYYPHSAFFCLFVFSDPVEEKLLTSVIQ